MRGVGFIVAVTVVAEVGDFQRFDSPRQLMAYLGLTPSEHSSGASVRRGGITKAGINIPETILKEISRKCVEQVRATVLAEQMIGYNACRRQNYDDFVSRHPIYGFDDPDVQLARVPFNAQTPEEFATGLVKYQIRRDEERQSTMENVIELLAKGEEIPESFAERLQKAVREVQSSEQLALAQHVVRRKLVLDLMGKLLTRVREREGKQDDYHLEQTLHSFIVPMHIIGNDANEKRSRAHDLWILDERLAFTRAFSSDKRFDALLKDSQNGERSDLIVWDFASGLGVADPARDGETVDTTRPLDKVMIVEFKKPGRTNYGPEDQIHFQITKYIDELREGEIEGFPCPIHAARAAAFGMCRELFNLALDFVHQGKGRVRVVVRDVIDNRHQVRDRRGFPFEVRHGVSRRSGRGLRASPGHAALRAADRPTLPAPWRGTKRHARPGLQSDRRATRLQRQRGSAGCARRRTA